MKHKAKERYAVVPTRVRLVPSGEPHATLRQVSKLLSDTDRFDLLCALDEAIEMQQCIVESNYLPPRRLSVAQRQERQMKLDMIRRYKAMQRQLRFWLKANGKPRGRRHVR